MLHTSIEAQRMQEDSSGEKQVLARDSSSSACSQLHVSVNPLLEF